MVKGLQPPTATGLRLSNKVKNQHPQESGAVLKFRNLTPKMTLDTRGGKRKALGATWKAERKTQWDPEMVKSKAGAAGGCGASWES